MEAKIVEEVIKHLPGKHEQASHGGGKGGKGTVVKNEEDIVAYEYAKTISNAWRDASKSKDYKMLNAVMSGLGFEPSKFSGDEGSTKVEKVAKNIFQSDKDMGDTPAYNKRYRWGRLQGGFGGTRAGWILDMHSGKEYIVQGFPGATSFWDTNFSVSYVKDNQIEKSIEEKHHSSHEVEFERWLKKPKGKLLHEDTAEEAMDVDESGDLDFYSEEEVLEGKHLPDRHDQKAHGGTRGATSQEVKTGSKKAASSLEKRLKGKELGNHVIKAVKKTGEKKERLVIFEDGSGMFFPSFALAKLAWGGTGKNVGHGEVAKMFRTAGELHKAGFTSWVQANYLRRHNIKVFDQIIGDAKAGKRKWNAKTRKIDIRSITKSQVEKKAMSSEQLSIEAMDKEFAEIEDVPMSEIIKYGRPAGNKIVKKGYDDMDDELEEEITEDEFDEGLEYDKPVFESINELESAFDIANEFVNLFNGTGSGEVISVKTFAEDGLGFLGPGINVYTDDDCFVIAVKEITTGDLTQEAVTDNQLNPASSFLQDLIGLLQDETDIPGLDDVYINNDDDAQVPVVSFMIDDGTEFRAYVLGVLDIAGSEGDLVEMSFAYPVEKADQVCLKTIWAEAYKYYTGKWISAAMQMQKAGKFDKAAEAFENARDGYQREKNKSEWDCLDAWRQEMSNKAAV